MHVVKSVSSLYSLSTSPTFSPGSLLFPCLVLSRVQSCDGRNAGSCQNSKLETNLCSIEIVLLQCICIFFLQATIAQDDEGRNYCQYDSDIATGLGVGSFFMLVASQVIIMVVTRCLCCGKAMRPSGSRSWAICLFITSWYLLLIYKMK